VASKAEKASRKDATRSGEPQVTAAESVLSASDILEALPFYAMLIDDQHRIVDANGAVRRQLGLEPEGIVGEYCPRVVHGLDQPWYACPLEEAVDKGGIVEREALDKESGLWIRSAIYPTGQVSRNGRKVYFHVVYDISDRKLAEEQLRASREQLRELHRHLESLREAERTRMAREIHDELGQTLTALKIDLSWLAGKLPREPGSLVEKTESMSALVDGTIQTVKRLSTELRPAVLDDLGLADAIEWQTNELCRRTGMRSRFTASPDGLVLDHDRSTAVFRICQEALTNIARHAQATRVSVSLSKRRDRISLRVSDNGKGIQEDQIADPRAFGLVGMRERAGFWGGEVRISRAPGKGTLVVVNIPLDRST
jgi:PAS domain S-box-containing protein